MTTGCLLSTEGPLQCIDGVRQVLQLLESRREHVILVFRVAAEVVEAQQLGVAFLDDLPELQDGVGAVEHLFRGLPPRGEVDVLQIDLRVVVQKPRERPNGIRAATVAPDVQEPEVGHALGIATVQGSQERLDALVAKGVEAQTETLKGLRVGKTRPERLSALGTDAVVGEVNVLQDGVLQRAREHIHGLAVQHVVAEIQASERLVRLERRGDRSSGVLVQGALRDLQRRQRLRPSEEIAELRLVGGGHAEGVLVVGGRRLPGRREPHAQLGEVLQQEQRVKAVRVLCHRGNVQRVDEVPRSVDNSQCLLLVGNALRSLKETLQQPLQIGHLATPLERKSRPTLAKPRWTTEKPPTFHEMPRDTANPCGICCLHLLSQ
eukprot:scaffold7328_cov314-Pinguiococcus_pyrenoidosus.AAC.70